MRLEVAGEETTTQVVDHHGLIAAICKDLKVSERINERIGSKDPRRVVQPGVAVVAMIINALGFTNRTLYLTPQFYKSKAINLFFDEQIEANDLDDHTLGKALDEISKYGATRLFGELAFNICEEMGLLGKLGHLDTTSFSFQGKYETEETEVVEVKHGFSKDHRKDLKQVVLSLIMTGPANLPVWMEPQDGNSSDKTSFHETIERVQSFTKNLGQEHAFCWVADSALYTADKLLKHDSIEWISRVPESINEAKNLVERSEDSFKWHEEEKGYRWCEVKSSYGKINQRWIVVSSEQAYNREKKTLERKLKRKKEELEKDCWHLSNKLFNCSKDAEKAVTVLQKKYKYHTISYEIIATKKYPTSGRPRKDSSKKTKGYQVKWEVLHNKEAQEKALTAKGRFILATNNLNSKTLPGDLILKQYKEQQNVECGFRFLKDPWFMLDSFYVKKRSRIEALMMVMTLSLMVYNYAQYLLRKKLMDDKETVPNQLGKPIQNPTLKWVFQLLEGIAIVKLYDAASQEYRTLITNLDDLRRKIINFMGPTACKIYGLA